MSNTYEGVANRIDAKTFQVLQRMAFFNTDFAKEMRGASTYSHEISSLLEVEFPLLKNLDQQARDLLVEASDSDRLKLVQTFRATTNRIYFACLNAMNPYLDREAQLIEGTPDFIQRLHKEVFSLIQEIYIQAYILLSTLYPVETSTNA